MKAPRNPLSAFLKKPRKGKYLTEEQLLSSEGSSTHSLGFVTPLKTPLHAKQHVSPSKRVQFVEDQNTYHEYFLNDDGDASLLMDACWYTPEELEHMKKSNSFTIQATRRSSQAVSSQQDQLETYTGVLELLYEQQGNIDPNLLHAWHTQQGLWMARHGLEHKLTKSATLGRNFRRQKLAKVIRELGNTDSLELAQRCAMLTEHAAWFAYAIAQ